MEITWSTLDDKDALAMTGKAPVVRSLPMVSGIDFAGVIADSWGVGKTRAGDLVVRPRGNGGWLATLPALRLVIGRRWRVPP